MESKSSNQTGLTLIELILTTSIFSMILSVVVSLFFYTQKRQPDYQIKSQVQLQYRLAFEEYSKMIAQAIQAEPTHASHNFPTDLILKLPAIDSNQQIIASSYDYIIFSDNREIVVPATGSSRTASIRRLIDAPVTVAKTYLKTDGSPTSLQSEAGLVEQVNITFTKAQLINGQSITFQESRNFSLRNH